MDFSHSEKVRELQQKVQRFMDDHVYPAEPRFDEEMEKNRRAGNPWQATAVVEELKRKARAENLWNLFLPHSEHGAGLSNLEYAPLCEIMGRSHLAPEAFNCSAPDTGNMEVLARYATPEQQQRWLVPLLEGRIRSAFAMTEPDVASSDATNIKSSIVRDGDEYVINGRKWWTSGAGDPRCEILIFMGRDQSDRSASQPAIDDPGTDERPPASSGCANFMYSATIMRRTVMRRSTSSTCACRWRICLLGEGRGFEIAQGRLGPGRIHHCMRLIGVAERALEMMCKRAQQRVVFGRRISEQGVTLERIAESRILIDQARWLVLNAAYMMDTVGNRAAKKEIAMIKVAAPNMACQVIDWAIQVHGGGGVSDDFPLAAAYAAARTLRFADGPDEVHREQIGKLELGRHRPGSAAPAR